MWNKIENWQTLNELSKQYVLTICDHYKAFQELNVYLLNVPNNICLLEYRIRKQVVGRKM